MDFRNITSSKSTYRNRLLEIFWATSVKKKGTFLNQEKEANFRRLYFDDYFDSGSVYVVFEQKNILGYLLIIDDTKNLIIKNKQLENIYLEFTNEVNDFPASLHINTYPSSQGKGVGSMLINNAINEKKVLNKDYKIHLITHIDSSNVKFYEKLKFRIQKTDSERRVFLGLTYY